MHHNVTPCYNTFKALGTTEMDLRFSFVYIQAPCHKIYKSGVEKEGRVCQMQVLCQDFGQGNSSSGRSRSRELTKPKDIASYVSSCYEGGQHRFHQTNGSKLTTSSKVIGTLVCILWTCVSRSTQRHEKIGCLTGSKEEVRKPKF